MSVIDAVRKFLFDKIRKKYKKIETNADPPGYYKYPQDKFLKDLGVCSLRMIPTDVRKIHLTVFQ